MIDLTNADNQKVKAKVKANQAIQLGVFVGFDNKGSWTVADGEGFTIQSIPANEWEETMSKGRAIFKAVAMATEGL